jgi:hypothetical protein
MMKVLQCIDNKFYEKDLTLRRVYYSLDETAYYYILRDNNGDKSQYGKSRFAVLREIPNEIVTIEI